MGGTSSSQLELFRAHQMRFGTSYSPQHTSFRFWAPAAREVELVLYSGDGERSLPLERSEDGWFTATVDGIKVGQKYHFRVNDLRVPDPASRCQAGGVHGPSVVVNPNAYRWGDASWQGRPWEETVLYELHVGTFTKLGTYRAIIEKLDYLKDLGITAVELMPVSDFPGQRNWGYDGVLHFAPAESYGSPEDLKALVDACHQRGLQIFLDVVYNHFGPEGNYLHVYANPPFFTEKYKTPWGAAIDFESAQSKTVREFFIENSIYWLKEFHFDGLRFDAVHAIHDASATHFLEELARTIKQEIGTERHVHLVLENDDNNAHLLQRKPGTNKPQFFTAQWDDDYHHCVHVIATGETSGYYADYAQPTSFASAHEHLARVLTAGFAYQGDASQLRKGEPRGQQSAHLPAPAFVTFMQNHDQIGNRAFGDRIAKITTPEKLRAITAITLLSPHIPMLFMGEEWASQTPFLFFADFGPELAPLVAEGRRNEFAHFAEFKDEKMREKIPDPTAEQTFARSVLDWSEREFQNNSTHLEFVRTLLKIRFGEVVPRLPGIRSGARWQKLSETAFEVRWQLGDEELILKANLGDTPISTQTDEAKVLYTTHGTTPASSQLSPWCVIWQIKHAKQG